MGLATLVGCSSAGTHTAYVSLPNLNAVAAYRINNSSAAFTNIVGSPYPGGDSPVAVRVHPSSKFVYVANQSENDISLFTIDSAIGSLHEVLPRTATGLTPVALTIDSAGNFLYALNQVSGNISVYSINSGTVLYGSHGIAVHYFSQFNCVCDNSVSEISLRAEYEFSGSFRIHGHLRSFGAGINHSGAGWQWAAGDRG